MFSFIHLQPIKWIRPMLAFALLVVLMSVPILAQTFVTDAEADAVTVPEGGTVTFQVKLSAQPSSKVDVTVSWTDGDDDITVLSGSSLTFASKKWNKYQTVTLAAAEDVDTAHDQATIRISDDASVLSDKDVTATEQDNDEITFLPVVKKSISLIKEQKI